MAATDKTSATVRDNIVRLPVALSVTQNGRIVVLCNDHSIWHRILDPQNMTGGEKYVWAQVEGPPTA